MVQDRETFWIKAKNFFVLNWWLLWILLVASTAHTFYSNAKTTVLAERALEAVEKNSKSVVMLSYAGTPIHTEKTTVDIESELFQKTLKAILQKYLITDATRITKDYTRIPATIEDTFNMNEELKDFNQYFLQTKNDANAFNFMKNHLKVILGLLKEDNLPETIVLLESKIEKYEIKDNTFKVLITANIKVDYFLVESNAWNRKNGAIKIEATGKFDPSTGNAFNPLGIKIDYFKVMYPKKRENKL